MEDELNSEEITYKFDVRDFNTDEVLAYIDRDILMVNAVHKNQSPESREEKCLYEKINLPSNIDVDSLQVIHEHGLLTVKLRRRRGSTSLTTEDHRNYERQEERERQREKEREERRIREREREMERERERERHSAESKEREREFERQREWEREREQERKREWKRTYEKKYEKWS